MKREREIVGEGSTVKCQLSGGLFNMIGKFLSSSWSYQKFCHIPPPPQKKEDITIYIWRIF
jgi:hypothetical protein